MAGTRNRRGFGNIRKLPSGRYQASYAGPDLIRANAPSTFQTKGDAEAWLSAEQRLIAAGEWTPPKARNAKPANLDMFGPYADAWLNDRTLKPSTRALYRKILRKHLLPTFESMRVTNITPAVVRTWYATLDGSTPTMRAHSYSLLRTILMQAVDDELITSNPCRIRGAGSSKRVHKIRPATLPELETIVQNMPERYRALVLLSAWCGFRFGEAIELRRKDLDVKDAVIRVRRAITRVDGRIIVGEPKSGAGIRDVAIPPHLLPAVEHHLKVHAQPGRNGLLFPSEKGQPLSRSTLIAYFRDATSAAARPDLRWHDLRHTGAVLAAATGATLAELMGRLGHSTPSAALRYQHAAQGRDAEIAARLSEIAGGQS